MRTTDLIKKRTSCRNFNASPVETDRRQALQEFCTRLPRPFWGNIPDFHIVDTGPPGKGRVPGSYGMIKGAGTFLVGTLKRGHRDMEDFGYLFEQAILQATRMDLATCWIGLTVSRNLLSEKITIGSDETIPAVTPLGYPAKRRSLMESLTRASIGAAKRKPWNQLFFDTAWGRPLDASGAADYATPLEMVRLAPSSTNKQPWRIVKDGNMFHFFLQRSPGYYAKMTSAADLQRIDMGIAMCHFELAAKELSLEGQWVETRDLPPGPLPKRTEYVVSWAG